MTSRPPIFQGRQLILARTLKRLEYEYPSQSRFVTLNIRVLMFARNEISHVFVISRAAI